MDTNKDKRNSAPILIIVICAGFSMVVDTISSSIKIMGYDEVIQADAKARANKILQSTQPNKELTLKIKELTNRLYIAEETIKHLQEDSHKPTK